MSIPLPGVWPTAGYRLLPAAVAPPVGPTSPPPRRAKSALAPPPRPFAVPERPISFAPAGWWTLLPTAPPTAGDWCESVAVPLPVEPTGPPPRRGNFAPALLQRPVAGPGPSRPFAPAGPSTPPPTVPPIAGDWPESAAAVL